MGDLPQSCFTGTVGSMILRGVEGRGPLPPQTGLGLRLLGCRRGAPASQTTGKRAQVVTQVDLCPQHLWGAAGAHLLRGCWTTALQPPRDLALLLVCSLVFLCPPAQPTGLLTVPRLWGPSSLHFFMGQALTSGISWRNDAFVSPRPLVLPPRLPRLKPRVSKQFGLFPGDELLSWHLSQQYFIRQ